MADTEKAPERPPRTDAQRIDWMERTIREEGMRGQGVIVLGAWWSQNTQRPDGYSVNVGELNVHPEEWESLREAIDDAMDEEEAPDGQD